MITETIAIMGFQKSALVVSSDIEEVAIIEPDAPNK